MCRAGRQTELSKKKKKMARQMRIAELKQQCSKPEVVEVWDVTAQVSLTKFLPPRFFDGRKRRGRFAMRWRCGRGM